MKPVDVSAVNKGDNAVLSLDITSAYSYRSRIARLEGTPATASEILFRSGGYRSVATLLSLPHVVLQQIPKYSVP